MVLPQGMILGQVMLHCVLFYVNDTLNHVKFTTKLFADDCKLYRDIRTRDDCALLQDDLDSLAAWSRGWLPRFSREKCCQAPRASDVPLGCDKKISSPFGEAGKQTLAADFQNLSLFLESTSYI